MLMGAIHKYSAKCLYNDVQNTALVVWLVKIVAVKGLVPGLAVVLILLLGFLAFKGGFSLLSPTGLVALDNSTVSGTFDITKSDITVSADHTTIKFSAPESARIITRTDEINSSGNFMVTDFVGTIRWDTKNIILEGNMESLSGSQLNIKFTNRESATVIMRVGSVDALSVNMSSFREKLTGGIRLENRFTIKLNQTLVSFRDYRGSVNYQRVNNITTMMVNGRADNSRVEQENILKNIA
jgi:hypothetical protein